MKATPLQIDSISVSESQDMAILIWKEHLQHVHTGNCLAPSRSSLETPCYSATIELYGNLSGC